MAKVHVDHCPLCHAQALKPVFSVRDHQVSGEYFMLERCAACGFLLTQDHPDAVHSAAYYASTEYISHSDTQEGMINTLYHWVRQWMLRRKFRLIHRLQTNKKILDYGCGTGYFLHTMKQGGWEVTGMDVNREAARTAQEKFGITVHPVEQLPRHQKTFNVITLWHVLEHVHALKDTLQNVHRALADDGYLVLALPNHRSLDALHYHEHWAGYDVPRHLWHFDANTVILATKPHFKLISRSMLPFDAFYVSLLSEKYRSSGRIGMLRACWVGLRSWWAGLLQVNRASSIVYVFKKK